MNTWYQVVVRMEIMDGLVSPAKCAYCLEPSTAHITVKTRKPKRFKLKVPYCDKHWSIIYRLKMIDKAMLFFFLAGMVALGSYLHQHQVIVIGNAGFNFIAAELIFLGVYGAVYILVKRILSRSRFGDFGNLDWNGAAKLGLIYADAIVLHFRNQTFATEFSELNNQRG